MTSIRKRALLSSTSPLAREIERDWGLRVFQELPVVAVGDQWRRLTMQTDAIINDMCPVDPELHELLSEMTANPVAGVSGVELPPPGSTGEGGT